MRPNYLFFLCALALHGQVSVLTYHNDLARTGQNLNETQLTPANVSSGQFGPLFSYPVDGQVYAQPLYLPGVSIPGKGVHNVVFVATEHDSVYAFDADSQAAPLWQASFLNPAAGVTAASSADLQCNSIQPEVGITATPVIDASSGTLYVVAMTEEGEDGPTEQYVQRLHALDVTTGSERPGSPVAIQASLPGTGDGNTVVRFQPGLTKERAGLLLSDGVVYTSWSSQCDSGNYHGWVIGYDAKTLRQTSAWAVTPNWDAGAIWQSGAAPAADADGNIYVVSGNGTFDGDNGGLDLAESVIKLSTAQGLSVADYFAPFNATALSEEDLDLGSSGAVLLPAGSGSPAHPRLLVNGTKYGGIFVLDADNLGHFQSAGNSQIVQSLPSAVGPVFGVPAYWNGNLYFAGAGDNLKAFSVTNGLLSSQPVSESVAPIEAPGAVPSVSANGSTNGIVWITDRSAQLHAFDALDLSHELYRAGITAFVKFSTPAIADGKVFVGTANSLMIFGLKTSAAVTSVVNAGGFQPGPMAPGSIISVFGSHLAPAAAGAPGAPWPIELGGSSVTVNGIPAPLSFVSPAQINAQIPFEIPPGNASLTVSVGGIPLAPSPLMIQPAAPGVFLSGPGRALALNQDGTINGPEQPAPAGTELTAFLTGQGALTQTIPSGAAALADPPIEPVSAISGSLGGQPVDVLSARMAPGMVGVLLIEIRVPALAPGDYAFQAGVGNAVSNPGLITVGGN